MVEGLRGAGKGHPASAAILIPQNHLNQRSKSRGLLAAAPTLLPTFPSMPALANAAEPLVNEFGCHATELLKHWRPIHSRVLLDAQEHGKRTWRCWHVPPPRRCGAAQQHPSAPRWPHVLIHRTLPALMQLHRCTLFYPVLQPMLPPLPVRAGGFK
jgi:hypothetical protein